MDAPLVVAANARELGFDIEEDAMNALLGNVEVVLRFDETTSPPTLVEQETKRRPGGIWNTKGGRTRYTRLKAVILFERLSQFNLASPVRVYFNPYVDSNEVPDELYRLPHAIGEEGQIRFAAGESVESLVFANSR